ncbi:hypothetical protein ACQPYK_04220 [Streptosporangium sp. CA-135522]|uniref:hypothetical protein n=1 Tax=Streptosporangium sp. CA-135522 TaxID=3240072 RepID=UPI003D8CEE3F
MASWRTWSIGSSATLSHRTELLDYSAPDGSIALRSNGNHCDYRARFTLSTQLTGRELTDYYAGVNIAGIEGGQAAITVWMAQPAKRSAYFDRGVAIVELYDSTGDGFDFRCT